MGFTPIIKWTGSKRHIAPKIFQYFPTNYEKYYEPFVGGGSLLYLVNPSSYFLPRSAMCSDICQPLIDLWHIIQTKPKQLIISYQHHWDQLKHVGESYYYEMRDQFNQTKDPFLFFFLDRTCMNGLIRFNKKGEFNSPFHFSRDGIIPDDDLRRAIMQWRQRVYTVQFFCMDYTQLISTISSKDFVFFDPPYFHSDGMYASDTPFDPTRFFATLEKLNQQGVQYAVTLDGSRGDTNYTVDVPKHLYNRHILLNSQNSSFSRIVTQQVVEVTESLYLNY